MPHAPCLIHASFMPYYNCRCTNTFLTTCPSVSNNLLIYQAFTTHPVVCI